MLCCGAVCPVLGFLRLGPAKPLTALCYHPGIHFCLWCEGRGQLHSLHTLSICSFTLCWKIFLCTVEWSWCAYQKSVPQTHVSVVLSSEHFCLSVLVPVSHFLDYCAKFGIKKYNFTLFVSGWLRLLGALIVCGFEKLLIVRTSDRVWQVLFILYVHF